MHTNHKNSGLPDMPSRILLVLVVLLAIALFLDLALRRPQAPQTQIKTASQNITDQNTEKSGYLENLEKTLKAKEEVLKMKEQFLVLKQKALSEKEAEMQKTASRKK